MLKSENHRGIFGKFIGRANNAYGGKCNSLQMILLRDGEKGTCEDINTLDTKQIE